MNVALALLLGVVIGLYVDRQTVRRLRAERTLARLQRDRAEQDRDQALSNNVHVIDPKRLALAIEKHPAGNRLGQR